MYFSFLNISLKMAPKRPEHVGGLLHICIPLYQIIVKLLECKWVFVASLHRSNCEHNYGNNGYALSIAVIVQKPNTN